MKLGNADRFWIWFFIGAIIISYMTDPGCPKTETKNYTKTHTFEFRKNYCKLLKEKIGNKVEWKDVYGNTQIMEVNIKFKSDIYYARVTGYKKNCIITTKGINENEFPWVIQDPDYDRFNQIYRYLKRGMK